jgi:hypothetical protein
MPLGNPIAESSKNSGSSRKVVFAGRQPWVARSKQSTENREEPEIAERRDQSLRVTVENRIERKFIRLLPRTD